MIKLILLFTLVPLAELYILLEVAENTSAGFTFALVLGTGIVGATLARWQGFSWRRRLHEDLTAGRLPADSLLDGLLIFIAGALLITPGILTDVVGFSLLVPPLRALVKGAIKRRFMRGFSPGPGGTRPQQGEARHDVIIDSYVIERKPDDESENGGDS